MEGIRGPDSRLIIVSNRLPITIEERNGSVEFLPSSGGLVSGLGAVSGGAHDKSTIWIGWPGHVSRAQQRFVGEMLEGLHGCVPVFLSDRLIERYYDGFSNRTIWPLFHSFQSFAKYSSSEWDAYVEANSKFMQVLDGIVRPGDRIWIHDYQLMLLPGLVRSRFPAHEIGFFLHIPFPPFEVLSLLPQHREILKGLLACDLIGFHINDYARSFLNGVHRVFGIDDRLGRMIVGDRAVQAVVHPMGVDFHQFSGPTERGEYESIKDLNSIFSDTKVIFSVSRLDYTKGIPQALSGFELLLQRRPELAGKVTLVLAVVPSRERVERYAHLKREIDEFVGRINSKYGGLGWVPIRYLYRSLESEELRFLYKNVDVCLVTPLRDGMNLIAKEFVASRDNGRGVLILSEMAGAAKELLEAIIVNPNSREDLADALERALEMKEPEQQSRIGALRQRLLESPVRNWKDSFLKKLDQAVEDGRQLVRNPLGIEDVNEIVRRFETAKRRLLLLDYDGTLVPLVNEPSAALPDVQLCDLLSGLAADPFSEVWLVSGRSRANLAAWFAATNVCLAAEHGTFSRPSGDRDWASADVGFSAGWREELKITLQSFVEKIPGSAIEEKEHSIVWHYRRADAESSDSAVKDLVLHLLSVAGEQPIRIVPGSKAIEVRSIGVGKGAFLRRQFDLSEFDFILCIGDDVTDEDLFRALPADAFTIKVGSGFTHARARVRDHYEVRRLLQVLAEKPFEPELNQGEEREKCFVKPDAV